jgi:trans-aconitate methyltransferase
MSSHFDDYADDYDGALAEGIAVSGEGKEFFAHGRIAWLARVCPERPATVMDYGCGTATATPYLFDLLGARTVVGVDVSPKSLDVARETYKSETASFHLLDDYGPAGDVDLVFSNGVFHHIPPPEREAAVDYVWRSLRPGGLFALWENNPWNPGTRYIMSRCPFDDDAITLSPPESRRLLSARGFSVVRCDFAFFFPRVLSALRFLEPRLARVPFGAQYMVLGSKPE